MEIKFKDGLKKIKFYDRLLWIALMSFSFSIVVAISSPTPLSDLMSWIFIPLLLIFIFTFSIFYMGMLYWMVLTKNFLLLFLSVFMGFITILFYFGRMRRKYFKEEKI